MPATALYRAQVEKFGKHPFHKIRAKFFPRNFAESKIPFIFAPTNGGLAQLARALAWHARGHEFESRILHQETTQKIANPCKSRIYRDFYFGRNAEKGIEKRVTCGLFSRNEPENQKKIRPVWPVLLHLTFRSSTSYSKSLKIPIRAIPTSTASMKGLSTVFRPSTICGSAKRRPAGQFKERHRKDPKKPKVPILKTLTAAEADFCSGRCSQVQNRGGSDPSSRKAETTTDYRNRILIHVSESDGSAKVKVSRTF